MLEKDLFDFSDRHHELRRDTGRVSMWMAVYSMN